MILVLSYLLIIGVGTCISCRISITGVSYINISFSKFSTSIGEERADLPAIDYT